MNATLPKKNNHKEYLTNKSTSQNRTGKRDFLINSDYPKKNRSEGFYIEVEGKGDAPKEKK